MFVKNFSSIKRETICVDDATKNFLLKNGYCPISKKDDGWVYLAGKEIKCLLSQPKGGDMQDGKEPDYIYF